MKTLECREVGYDCGYKVRAATEEEVLKLAAEHARTVHNMEVTPDIAEKVKTLIKEEV
jgi:predicted small metal-binding protein